MPASTTRKSKYDKWQYIVDPREKYQAYLCSRDWWEKRDAVARRCSKWCERCRCFPMEQVHHLTYERKFNERLEDLQAVCEFCHEFIHGLTEVDPLQVISRFNEIGSELVHRLKNSGPLTSQEEIDLLERIVTNARQRVAAMEAAFGPIQRSGVRRGR